MQARVVTSLGLIVALALLLPVGAPSFASQALPATLVAPIPQGNAWPDKLDAPLQPSEPCSLRLNPALLVSGRASGQVLTAQSPDIQPEQAQLQVESVLILAASMLDRIPRSVGLPIASARSTQPARVQANGYITGVVKAADTGQPPHVTVRVEAYDITGILQAGDFADYVTGVYSITVPSGTYRVKFKPYFSSYVPEWYNNRRDFASATPVVVTDGAVRQNINAVLEVGGKIAGRVTAAAGGAPLKDIDVGVYEYGCACYCSYMGTSSATTDASGVYTVTGLLPGSYGVLFYPHSSGASAMYVAEYYNDQTSLTTGDLVVVADGSVTSGIDAALELGGQIAGRITAADGGSPLSDVWVHVYDARGDYVYGNYTDATGVYTTSVLSAGSYRLSFDPISFRASAVYLSKYYSNKSALATADPVPVTGGNVTSHIDTVLDRGGQITGRVTADDGAGPLQGVSINVYDGNGFYRGSAATDARGIYTTTGLTTGSFLVGFGTWSAPGVTEDYLDEYYNNKSSLATADPVPVTAPNLTSGINAVLTRGGKISGQVTAGDTGGPLSGIQVSAYDSSGRTVRSDTTDSSGNYSISGLPTGNYRVRFYGICIYFSGSSITKTYFGEYYNDKFSLATADWVQVIAPNTTSGINAVLGGGTLKFVFLPVVLR